jgi:hypothetical protein
VTVDDHRGAPAAGRIDPDRVGVSQACEHAVAGQADGRPAFQREAVGECRAARAARDHRRARAVEPHGGVGVLLDQTGRLLLHLLAVDPGHCAGRVVRVAALRLAQPPVVDEPRRLADRRGVAVAEAVARPTLDLKLLSAQRAAVDGHLVDRPRPAGPVPHTAADGEEATSAVGKSRRPRCGHLGAVDIEAQRLAVMGRRDEPGSRAVATVAGGD